MGHLPNTDDVISVTSIEVLAISRPSQGNAGRGLRVLGDGNFGAKLINNALAFQIPDLDAGLSGSAEPVPVGAEAKGVDDVASIERIQVLPFVEIPEHGESVLSS